MRIADTVVKDAHERWAQQRIKDEWTYGAQRDDQAKTHPGLVPFDDLPKTEQPYARLAATGTLLLLVKLGFVIQPAPPPEDRLMGRLKLFGTILLAMLLDCVLLTGWLWLQPLAAQILTLAPMSAVDLLVRPTYQILFAVLTLVPVLTLAVSDISRILRERRRALRRQ
jgi:hypothetical protein